MTPPRTRFTVRQVMVAVAGLALVLRTVAGLRRRRDSFQQQAQMFSHKVSATILQWQAYRLDHRSSRPDSPFFYDHRISLAYNRLVEHYDALRIKYAQAADRPWRFVAPAPPGPAWPAGGPRW